MAALTDLKTIYNDEYKYCVPEGFVASCYSGKAFDNKQAYTESEKEALGADITEIYDSFGKLPDRPVAVITAGAPGAGKTTLMESLLQEGCAYVDPDAVCLKSMTRTYQQELREKGEDDKDVRREIYNKWRPASIPILPLLITSISTTDHALTRVQHSLPLGIESKVCQ